MSNEYDPGQPDPYQVHLHRHSGYGEPAEDPHPGETGGGLARLVNICGAAASLALIAGIGVWGYKLVIRDVSGVPVVRAIEGPMRVQPDNPGGTPADHQGLAVNTVAARGTAAPPPDRLILAPKPVDLDDEDQPMAALQPTMASLSVDPVAPRPRPQPVPREAVEAYRAGSVDALVAALTGDTEPLDDPTDDADTAAAGMAAQTLADNDQDLEEAIDPADLPQAEVEAIGLDAGGVARSLRPVPRPARSVAVEVPPSDLSAAIDAAVETAAGLDVDPEMLVAGTRLAQLGAYDSPEIARAEWDRLATRFSDYLDGKQRVIQKASSGGRTFYRLRAMGFADLGDARRFCSALVAEKADCIPVTVR